MTDRISRAHRSWNMSRIKNRDTAPEKKVRSCLHREGFRFRLHPKGLPGKPDVVLPKYRTAIFVHGCFWHRHQGCRFAYTPKTRKRFWINKLLANRARDKRRILELQTLGWNVITIWECEASTPDLWLGQFRQLRTNRLRSSDRQQIKNPRQSTAN